jgi:hypothetical protein
VDLLQPGRLHQTDYEAPPEGTLSHHPGHCSIAWPTTRVDSFFCTQRT